MGKRRLSRSALPRLDCAGHDSKERMRHRPLHGQQIPIALRLPPPELPLQVGPLKGQLSRCRGDPRHRAPAAELTSIERVPARLSFLIHQRKVAIQTPNWLALRPKPSQLGVMPVPLSAAAKHSTSEQRFTPEGDEADPVQIFRMHGP